MAGKIVHEVRQIIKIMKFEEFNPRKDVKKHSWFRVDNSIPFSKKLNKLTPDQKWLWICIIAWASADQKDCVEYDLDYFAQHSGVSEKKVKEAILHFENKELIQIVPVDVTDTLRARTDPGPTYVRTNDTYDTYDTNTTTPGRDDIQMFFDVWNSLPFKITRALKLTTERRDKIKTRLKEVGIDEWKIVMHKIGDYPFLLGEDENSKGWAIDLDWLIANEGNRISILEGKYKSRPKASTYQKNSAQAVVDRLKTQADRVASGDL